MGWLCLGLGTIEKITIEPPQGGLAVGNREELGDLTEELLATMLVWTLSGRAAEQELLGSVAACCVAETHDDIDLANEFAFALAATPNFARKWPLRYRPKANPPLLLTLDPGLRSLVNARLGTATKPPARWSFASRPPSSSWPKNCWRERPWKGRNSGGGSRKSSDT